MCEYIYTGMGHKLTPGGKQWPRGEWSWGFVLAFFLEIFFFFFAKLEAVQACKALGNCMNGQAVSLRMFCVTWPVIPDRGPRPTLPKLGTLEEGMGNWSWQKHFLGASDSSLGNGEEEPAAW